MKAEKISKMFGAFGSVTIFSKMRSKKPLYGQTLYIASCTIESRFCDFKAHIFQDLHSKDYCIALCVGSIISKAPLTSRIHSSCITSETLRALDSDDIQQLELAMSVIAKKKRGILYYLIQEGRGVGFTAKARDRMLVQSVQNLTSHEAFKVCGLHHDYRLYDAVFSINHLLGIKAPLNLLTNSPDKVQSIRNAGITISGTSSLLVQPYQHSIGYLKSKAVKGHLLAAESLTEESRRYFEYLSLPPKSISPFTPHAVNGAERFIHTASYLIPIKPVHGALIVNQKQLEHLTLDLKKLSVPGSIFSVIDTVGDKFVLQLDRNKIRDKLGKHANSLLSVPYWFTLHAYYDVATSEDIIVLEYGNCKTATQPLIRVHSESLFNRFPLEDVENRDKYKKSIFEIVKHGAGLVLLMQNDGRGAGFGIFALEKMLEEQRISSNSKAAYKQLGISYDIRDYDGAALLLRSLLKASSPKITLLTSSKKSLSTKPETLTSFADAGVKVQKIIFLSKDVKLPKAVIKEPFAF